MDAIPQNQSTRVISVRVATSDYIALLTEAESKKVCLSDLILMRLYGKGASSSPAPVANKTNPEKKPTQVKPTQKVAEPKPEPEVKAKPKARAVQVGTKPTPKKKTAKAKTKVSTPKKEQRKKNVIGFIDLT